MQPDYSKYSNLELREAINSIDKIKYSERYRKLKLEMESRGNEIEKDVHNAKKDNRDMWITIGCLLFVIPLFTFMGIDAIITGEFTLKHHVFTKEEHPLFFTVQVVFCFAIVLLLAVGLYKRSRRGT
ncbi:MULTISPECIES: NfeD family protein [Marisediminitalea]|uniref:NfeD family protein n=1 Tax=Marisediminitalea TaxID=2662254 RepID=UPI0020CE2879|nr:hypothetical protein [Marisediminitalea aggregata]MCP3864586.1 hypothetical protein [Aestuariibacter sp.]MCP4525127.1 hypothetical protein [Aestuariibacter sp.]MCP9476396.1 hypothetical protein [Marisediminitalea aggregata]